MQFNLKKMSLKQKSGVLVAAMALVLLTAYSVFSIYYVDLETRRLMEARLLHAEAVADDLDKRLERASNKIEAVARVRGLTEGLHEQDENRQGRGISAAATLHYMFYLSDEFGGGIFLVNKSGKILFHEPLDLGLVDTVLPGFPEIEKAIAEHHGQSHVMTLTQDHNVQSPSGAAVSGPQILIASPIVDPQEGTVGALIGAIPTNHMFIQTAIFNKDNIGNLQLVSPSRMVVASTESSRDFHPLSYAHAVKDLRAYELRVCNIELVTELAPVPRTMTDPHQLQQVFLNLIVNAEQSMIETNGRGRLAIRSTEKDEHIEISFEDDGPGIPEENLRRIFDPFFTTKAVGKGTGLGLSICQGIVAEHGGRLTASCAPGRGARFLIELPIVTVFVKEDPVQARAPKFDGKRVLVVDDESHLREMFQEILRSEGHLTQTAASGKEAMELVHRYEFDLVISDIKMPETDGPEFYRRLKAEGSRLADRLIFVTGDLMNPETVKFLTSTGTPWISKPFEIAVARQTINSILTSKAS